MSKNIMTPVFRVAYANVFKAKTNSMSGKEEFSVVALFPKNADLTQLKKAIQDAVEEEWGKDKKKWPAGIKYPFKDQGEKAKEVNGKMVLPPGYEKGAMLLNLKSQQRPGIVDQNVQEILDPSEFYSGCYARASVSVKAFSFQKMSFGVSVYLQNLQKVKDGEPLTGRSSPQEDFAPIGEVMGEETSANSLFS